VLVLSFVREQPQHGYDIVKRVAGTRARMWAKIGTATVYTVLGRLQRTGAVMIQRERKSLGPAKRVVSITAKGRSRLAASVRALLRSGASVYSDRIVGLAMSAALPRRDALREIRQTVRFLDRVIEAFRAYRDAEVESSASALVVGFYRDILAAELRACRRAIARPVVADRTPSARGARSAGRS
jgi:DNA-binding PadR family transcriptional regulator